MEYKIIHREGKSLVVGINNGQIIVESEKQIQKQLTSIINVNESDYFGRSEQLDNFHETLGSSNKVIGIRGIGGIGKTTFARLYLSKYYSSFDHIIWITVQGDIKRSFVSNDELLDSLYLDFKDESRDIERDFTEVITRIRELKGNNILILDNIGDEIESNQLIAKLSLSSDWNVAVTCRGKYSTLTDFELEGLSESASVSLFSHHYKGQVEKADVIDLVQYVKFHPLTIELLGKTLELDYNIKGPKELLRYLEEEKLDAEEIDVAVRLGESDSEASIYKTLMKTFRLSPLEGDKLGILARYTFFPSIDIHGSWLNNLVLINGQMKPLGKKKLRDSLNGLVKSGWLSSSKTHFFKCHSLIQDVLRYKFPPSFEGDGFYYVHLVTIANQVTLDQRVFLLPFFERAAKYTKDILGQETNTLQTIIAQTLSAIGQIQKSNDVISSLAKDEDNLSQSGYLLQRGENALALGNVGEAISLFETLIEKSKYVNEDSNEEEFSQSAARAHSELGDIYLRGDNSKAEYHYREELKIIESRLKSRDQVFPSDNYRLGTSYKNLSVVSSRKGNFQDAITLANKAIEHLKKAREGSKGRHPLLGVSDTAIDKILATTYSSLSDIYSDLGKYHLAARFCILDLELIDKQRKTGSSSILTNREYIVATVKLAEILAKQNKNEQAEQIFSGATSQFSALRERHPENLDLCYYDSVTHEKAGNFFAGIGKGREAATSYTDALKVIRLARKKNPTSRTFFMQESDILTKLNEFFVTTGYPGLAAQIALEATKLYEADNFHYSNIEKVVALMHLYTQIGKYSFDQKDWGTSVHYFHQGLLNSHKLEGESFELKEFAIIHTLKANAYYYSGLAVHQLGESEKAILLLQDSVLMWDELYKEMPSEEILSNKEQILQTINQIKPKKKSWWNREN